MNCSPCRLLVGALVGATISAGSAALACDPVCPPASDEKPVVKRKVIKLESMGDLAELDLAELGADVEFIFKDEDGARTVGPKGKTFQWKSAGGDDACCFVDLSAIAEPVMVAPGRFAVVGDDAGRFKRVQDFTVPGPHGQRVFIGDAGALRGMTLGQAPGGAGKAFTYAIAMDGDHDGHDGEAESHKVEVRIENGKVTATVDGREVDADRVSFDDGRIVIRDKNGKVIDLGGMMKRMRLPEGAGDPNKWMQELKVDDRFLRDGTLDRIRVMSPDDFTFEQVSPRVVIGVELSEPDEAVLRHLGLDGKVSEIIGVTEGFGAEKAGLKPLDIIVEIEGADGADAESIRKAISERDEGDTVEVVVIREGKRKSYDVTLKKWVPEGEDFQFGPGEARAFEWKFDDGGNVFFGGPGEGDGMRRFRVEVDGENGDGGQFFVLPEGVDVQRGLRLPGPSKGSDLETRVNRLEDRLDELADRLERLLDKLDR